MGRDGRPSRIDGYFSSFIRNRSQERRKKKVLTSTPQLNSVTHHEKGENESRFFVRTHHSQKETRKKIDWFATLAHAAKTLKFRYPLLKQQTLTIALLDTSSSILGGSGLSEAKGVLKQLAVDCYLQRQRLCIMTFGNNKIETVLKAQRAPKKIERILNKIYAGGGTPLRKALIDVNEFIARQQKQYPLQNYLLFVFTDGRSKEAINDIVFNTTMLTIVDTECGTIKLELGKKLADQFCAHYVHLQTLSQV